VTETLEKEKRPDDQPVPPKMASSRLLALAVPLAAFAAVCATTYALSNFNRFAERSLNQTASVPIPDPVISATLRDIQSSQQQSAAQLESLARSSAAQQADLRRILDQFSSLTARVESLQKAAEPVTTSTIPQPVARARVVRTARKKSSPLPPPVGPVSVQGAPLNPAPARWSGDG
jgi:uncharacterized protein involved in exopolysaccharide biosynthesis